MMAISNKKIYSKGAKSEGVFTHQLDVIGYNQVVGTAKLWEDHFKAAVTD
jgi:hypothetical protein